MRRKRDQDFYAEREVRTKVPPEVKSHPSPITKGNSPAEGKKEKGERLLSDEEGEEKN
jgi:hypothetical protein